jgi:hypothetical protein
MHLLLSSFFIITKLINLNYLNIQFEGEGILFSLCVNKKMQEPSHVQSSCMTIKKNYSIQKNIIIFSVYIYIYILLLK